MCQLSGRAHFLCVALAHRRPQAPRLCMRVYRARLELTLLTPGGRAQLPHLVIKIFAVE